MIIDSDLTEHINKFRATIKEDVALRENRVMYNELNTLADMARGNISWISENPIHNRIPDSHAPTWTGDWRQSLIERPCKP